MRVICVQDFGQTKVGDILVVPDGSVVAPGWFRPLTDEENAAIDGPPPDEAATATGDDSTDQAEAAGTDNKKGKG